MNFFFWLGFRHVPWCYGLTRIHPYEEIITKPVTRYSHACKCYDSCAQAFKNNATQHGHHETLTLQGPRSSMYNLHTQFFTSLAKSLKWCLFIHYHMYGFEHVFGLSLNPMSSFIKRWLFCIKRLRCVVSFGFMIGDIMKVWTNNILFHVSEGQIIVCMSRCAKRSSNTVFEHAPQVERIQWFCTPNIPCEIMSNQLMMKTLIELTCILCCTLSCIMRTLIYVCLCDIDYPKTWHVFASKGN